MTAHYTETALDEIEDILSYIAREIQPPLFACPPPFLATIDRIAEFPLMAVETDLAGVRMTLVLPYRYCIFFGIENGSLIIRNVTGVG